MEKVGECWPSSLRISGKGIIRSANHPCTHRTASNTITKTKMITTTISITAKVIIKSASPLVISANTYIAATKYICLHEWLLLSPKSSFVDNVSDFW